MSSRPDPRYRSLPHIVKIRKIKTRNRIIGSCTNPTCVYEVSAPDTPLGNRSVNNNATFHQNHHDRYKAPPTRSKTGGTR
jgi:hypothetical protein